MNAFSEIRPAKFHKMYSQANMYRIAASVSQTYPVINALILKHCSQDYDCLESRILSHEFNPIWEGAERNNTICIILLFIKKSMESVSFCIRDAAACDFQKHIRKYMRVVFEIL